MYNKLLNYTFDLFSFLDKSRATRIANSLVSPLGVKDSLLARLEQNELSRYKLFQASFKEDQANDSISKLEQRTIGKHKNGMIDAGQMYTQLYKVNLLKRMSFAEHYNTYITDKDNFQYFKLKYSSNFGEFENHAFRYHESVTSKDIGFFANNVRRYRSKSSEYPML